MKLFSFLGLEPSNVLGSFAFARFEEVGLEVSVKTRIDSNSGASEVSYVNGRGFNFDVAPLLVGIWCPLISRV